LYNYIKNTSEDIPTDIIVKFAKDIASGMNMVHSTGIVHRDLKSLTSFLYLFIFKKIPNKQINKKINKIDQIF